MLSSVLLAFVLAMPQAPSAPDDQATLSLQVALDRAGFSPGVIDGRAGDNTRRALEYYREVHGSDPPAPDDPLVRYAITEDDVRGPFAGRLPEDLMEQARLPALSYASPVEALAERFHTSPALLRRLNPEARFVAGEEIAVPDVEPFTVPEPRPSPAAAGQKPEGTAGRADPAAREPDKPGTDRQDVVVTVSKSAGFLTVQDARKRIVFAAPVTTGSERDPLPIGEWKVNGVQYSPVFHYNPDLFWNADPSHAKAKIAPGPNNPVGVVWIDLSKEHYGLHGTPEPAAIGQTASHGCVRLTNWDAVRVAGLVGPGTRVVFTE